MPRLLVMAECVVEHSARISYLQAMTARRQQAAAVGANFWAFERDNLAGNFLEFVEAGNNETLIAAIAALCSDGAGTLQMAPIWREVGGT